MKPKPAHSIRLGRIKATLWANVTPNGMRHNVQVCRLYKDGDTWKQTDSFGRDDLPVVCKVLDRAHTWIFEQRHTERSEPASNTDGSADGSATG